LRNWKIAVVAVLAVSGVAWIATRNIPMESRRAGPHRDSVFSPAHHSLSEAIQHFVGYRPEPQQPIAFVHRVHLEVAELNCVDCHITAARGPQASIPDIRTCWTCHENILTEHPEIRKLRGYFEKGHDIPWKRVWGWPDEAHVRFNHAPHIRAEVECTTCHGDVGQMTVATRAVEHTMNFCLNCHKQKNVSNDCVVCHY
jgi:hypothetical protein